MAALRCPGCHRHLGDDQPVCPACGYLAEVVAADAPDPVPAAGGGPAADGSPTMVIAPVACDHAAARPGAVLCPTCAVALPQPSGPAADAGSGRAAPCAVLILPDGSEVVVGSGDTVQLGRGAGPIAGQTGSVTSVSRRHATIAVTATGVVTVVDQQSTNGTFVNGVRCPPTGAVEVPDGAVVSLGRGYPLTVKVVR